MATRRLQVVIAGDARGGKRAIEDVGDAAEELPRKFERAGSEGSDGFVGGMSGLADRLGPVIAGLVEAFSDGLGERAGAGVLQAQLGLSDADAARFGRTAGDLYANNFGDSMGQAQEAVGAVGSTLAESLGPGGDALERASEQALTFAQAFGVDVETAVNTAGVAISSGLATDATHAFDLMTTASQEMPAAMREELMPAVEEYGQFFSALGITGEDAFGLLATASEDGMYGIDKTGDALKELTIRATDMSSGSVAAYQAAGLGAEDMSARFLAGGEVAGGAFDDLVAGLIGIEDPTLRANSAIALFGTPLEDLGVTEIPAFLGSLSTMETGLGDVGGATDRAADSMARTASPIEALKRQALGGLSDFISTVVIPGLASLGEALRPVVDWFRNVGAEVFRFVGSLQGVFREDGFSGVIDRIGEKFSELWPRVQLHLSQFVSRAGQWIQEQAPIWGERLHTWGAQLWGWIGPMIPPMLAQLGALANRVWLWLQVQVPILKDKLFEWGNAFWGWISPMIPPVLAKLGEFYVAFVGWMAEVFYPALVERLKEWGNAFWQWIEPQIPTIIAKVSEIYRAIAEWITFTAYPAITAKLREWGLAFGEWVVTTGIPFMLGKLAELRSALMAWFVETALPAIKAKLSDWAKAFGTWVIEEGIPQLIEKLTVLQRSMVTWFTETALPAIKRKLSEWAKAFGDWVINEGIPLLIEKLTALQRSLVTWFTESALPAIKTKLGEWARAFGDWVTEKGLPLLLEKLGALKASVTTWFTGTAIPWMKDKAAELFRKLVDAAKEKGDDLMGWALALPGRMGGWLAELGPTLLRKGRDAVGDMVSGLLEKLPSLSGAAGRLGDAVGAAFDRVPELFRSALRLAGGTVGGFLDKAAGIADDIGVGSIASALRGAAGKARGWGAGGMTRDEAARGYAAGGFIPGPNVEKDVVPIMAMPGEFMMQKSAVKKFGLKFMAALNEGRLPGFARAGGVLSRGPQMLARGGRIYEDERGWNWRTMGNRDAGGNVRKAFPNGLIGDLNQDGRITDREWLSFNVWENTVRRNKRRDAASLRKMATYQQGRGVDNAARRKLSNTVAYNTAARRGRGRVDTLSLGENELFNIQNAKKRGWMASAMKAQQRLNLYKRAGTAGRDFRGDMGDRIGAYRRTPGGRYVRKLASGGLVPAFAAGGVLSRDRVGELARQAGFGDGRLPVAVAQAESSLDPNAFNQNRNGSVDRGLWQINSIHGALSTFDPLGNARAAYSISSGGSDWSPWVAYTTGAHRQYLDGGDSGGGQSWLGRAASAISGAVSGLTARVTDALRDIAAGGLERVWPDRIPGLGTTGFEGMITGGANFVRSGILNLIRGEADKVEAAGESSETGPRGGGLAGSTTGLNTEFLGRFNDYSAAVGPLSISSGFRSRAQQEVLYQAYLDGTGNLAAPPGSSNHEKGLAIDHAPRATAAMKEIARTFRLHYPIRGEPWHVEPFAKGGLIGDGVTVHAKSFDGGGTLEPGWNRVRNLTGGRERLVPDSADRDVSARLDRLIAAIERGGVGGVQFTGDNHFVEELDVDRVSRRMDFAMRASRL